MKSTAFNAADLAIVNAIMAEHFPSLRYLYIKRYTDVSKRGGILRVKFWGCSDSERVKKVLADLVKAGLSVKHTHLRSAPRTVSEVFHISPRDPKSPVTAVSDYDPNAVSVAKSPAPLGKKKGVRKQPWRELQEQQRITLHGHYELFMAELKRQDPKLHARIDSLTAVPPLATSGRTSIRRSAGKGNVNADFIFGTNSAEYNIQSSRYYQIELSAYVCMSYSASMDKFVERFVRNYYTSLEAALEEAQRMAEAIEDTVDLIG